MGFTKKIMCLLLIMFMVIGMFDSKIINAGQRNDMASTDIKQGDIITFGSYEQDNDLTNGAEPIEWIVLSVEDDKALLLSKYALDYIC